MGQEKTIAALQNRITVLKQSMLPILDKIQALERAIEIIQVPTHEIVTNDLQIFTYPRGGDISLKMLYGVMECNRFVTKNEILNCISKKESDSTISLISQNAMPVLQKLVRNKKVVLARFNNSNLLAFYGYSSWLGMNERERYYILPEYEPLKEYQAKIMKETIEFRGI